MRTPRTCSQGRRTYAELANLAVNQTLVRSINTSIVALLPVGAILYVGVATLGSGALKDLALALFVGMAAGAYSSIFIATPLAVQLKSNEKEITQQDARAKARARRDVDRYADVPVFTEDMPRAPRPTTPPTATPHDGASRTRPAGAAGPATRGVRLGTRRARAPRSRCVSRAPSGRTPADASAALQARQVSPEPE